MAGVISWIWRFNSVHPMLLFLGGDRVMMSGGKGIFGSWEKVVARCGRSWPIARQHYRVPTTDASLIVSDVSALNFQNAVVDEGPCGGGRGRVSRRHHLPSGPTNPPPPPPPPPEPRDSESLLFPGTVPLSNILGPSHSSGLLASRVPHSQSFFASRLGKVSGPCQINIALSSFLLRPGSLPFPILSFSRIQHSAFPKPRLLLPSLD